MVLHLYGMSGYRPQDIPQFIPGRITIDRKGVPFQHCIADLQLKLKTMGSVNGKNEVRLIGYGRDNKRV